MSQSQGHGRLVKVYTRQLPLGDSERDDTYKTSATNFYFYGGLKETMEGPEGIIMRQALRFRYITSSTPKCFIE
ncbi:hypothetical protein J6590_012222 [Homalodisca vitripennis]|nr:hypothetical protein J6590_012222 [Homalodisca vitripennis]